MPQARDLFADTGFGFFSWFWFFVFLLVWAWVVHIMARRALQFDEWVPAAHASGGLSEDERLRLRKEFERPAVWIPRLLGLSVFAFVALALWITRLNLLPAIGLTQASVAAARIPVAARRHARLRGDLSLHRHPPPQLLQHARPRAGPAAARRARSRW